MAATKLKSSEHASQTDGGDQMSESITKIGDVVPSVYYDLIARIVPGVTVVAIASYIFKFTPPMTDAERAAATIGAGYVVGLLLSAVSTLILFVVTAVPLGLGKRIISTKFGETILRKLFADSLAVLAGAARRLERYSDAAFWNQIRNHEEDRHLSALLGKMAAESTCTENLVIAVSAIALIDPDRNKHIPVITAALALTVLAAIQRRVILARRLADTTTA